MKFMKLGSKPDTFQSGENNVRVVSTEYATDFTVNVGDVKFHVHKFPLMSRSYRLQKLYSNSDEIHLSDIPGGPAAFEICAKFCYGMTVTVNAYNVVAARCAAGYLEMYQTIDTGNLINKIDAFLDTSIFRSWKDSIIALQSTKPLLPWSEDLKLVGRCIDSIATRASIDPSKVDWSYAYDRKKLPSEKGLERKQQLVPRDWWVEDLCELEIDLYKRVMATIKAKGRVLAEVIGEALRSYMYRRLPGFGKGTLKYGGDIVKEQKLLETVVQLLPQDEGSVSCSFLLEALKAVSLLDCGEMLKKELVERVGGQLDRASVLDLLIAGDIDTVRSIVEEFARQDSSGSSKAAVAKVVDGYLAEIAKDSNLPLSEFVHLAEMVSGGSRPVHDGLYGAIDVYLKVHPGMSKSERKRLCGLMDCGRLSAEGRAHAIQNERLPTRVLVQILFFEQVRSSASSGSSAITEDSCRTVPGGSAGSGRSNSSSCSSDGNGKVKGKTQIQQQDREI